LCIDITTEMYRQAVQAGTELAFVCTNCKTRTPSPDIAFAVADDSFEVQHEMDSGDAAAEVPEVREDAMELSSAADEDAEVAQDASSEHVSFDVANISFNNPGDNADEDIQVLEDTGVESSLPSDNDDVENTSARGRGLTLVPGGSSRGRDKLVDEVSYSYTVKKRYVL